jgi:outer membrane protein assembly factor BamB
MRTLSAKVVCLLAVAATAAAFVASAGAQPAPTTAPAKVMGWRGDGSGRYPDARPAREWGRVARSVLELSAQAGKPKDDALPAKEAAIADGVIRKWLVLGPVAIPEDMKPEKVLPGAEALSPEVGDKAGDSKWQAVAVDSSCVDLCAVLNIAPNQKGFVAYAHAYVYSPSGQPVVFNFQFVGQGTSRIWLNGKQVLDAGREVDLGSGTRLVLALQKGWNRLLVMSAKTRTDRRGWWFTGTFYGEKTTDYETRGIVWMTPVPAPGTSAPVIVGDRLCFTAETGSVYCVSKADGNILWVRSLNYHDFVTDEERMAHREIMADLDVLAARVRRLDEADAAMPYKAPALEKDLRAVMEPQLLRGMEKVSAERFNHAGTWGCVAGYTPITPVTDGQYVYAVFGTGIVACYDPEGKLIWKRLLRHKMVEHGYGSSPLLVDGRLIIYMDDFTVLDPKTGDVIVERPHYIVPGTSIPANQFFGTGCVLPAGKEKVGYFNNNEFVRLSDGKTLSVDEKTLKKFKTDTGLTLATPVVEGGVAYKIVRNEGGAMSIKLPPLQGNTVEPEFVQMAPFNTDKLPYFYENFYCASPLLHEGLLYCLNDFGNLTVVDMANGEVLYQRHLDLDVFMPYNGGPLQGGSASSPTLAGKHIYIWGNQGTCLVLEPGRTFKQVARNRLENGSTTNYRPRQEATMTNPIFEGERMYYRAECAVYCIGPK